MPEPTALTLPEVARRLDAAHIPWAVFAGCAAVAYGAVRPVTDVDILVPAAAASRLSALFPEGTPLRDEAGVLRGVQAPGFDLIAGLPPLDLDAAMARRLQRHAVASVLVPVIPPEDNILLKAIWRRGPDQGKHDWEDVEAMVAHLPNLDWDYLRERAAAYGDDPPVEDPARPTRGEHALADLATLCDKIAPSPR
jgi:hypothetical protein